MTLGDRRATARTDAKGRWNAQLPAQPAGGPFSVDRTLGASRAQTANDVLVGDVWLCSGQSNMEWPVRNTHDAGNEAALSANAAYPSRRRYHAAAARAPRAGFDTALSGRSRRRATPSISPPSVITSCASCRNGAPTDEPVPQGIIHSSWGGSRIEPWMSDVALRQQRVICRAGLVGRVPREQTGGLLELGPDLAEVVELAQPATGGTQPWRSSESRGVPEQGQQDDTAPAAALAGLEYWETWNVPELSRYDGMVWYRAHVNLTAAQAKQAAKLSMGSRRTTWT